jgi:hypothetical protein
MPSSIENFISVIRKADSDGTLTRCHMFLNKNDIYLLHKTILANRIDYKSALKLSKEFIEMVVNEFNTGSVA